MLMAATMMLAARTPRGSLANQPVPPSSTASMANAETMLAIGLCAPAARLMAEREVPPPTGMPPNEAATMLAAPSPISSRLASTRSRRRMASACAMVMFCTMPMKPRIRAGMVSSLSVSRPGRASVKAPRPCGTSPTTATPYW